MFGVGIPLPKQLGCANPMSSNTIVMTFAPFRPSGSGGHAGVDS